MDTGKPARWLGWLIGTIDAMLRRMSGVEEFEKTRDGLLRIEIEHARRDLTLSDGSRIRAGEPVILLHLWNEQLLPFPAKGADFAWAVRMRRQILATLHRLALHMREHRRLDGVRAIRMQPALASGRSARALDRALAHAGFEPVIGAAAPRSPFFRFLDNVWLLLLTWAHNPRALRGRPFNRARREYWISRERFLAMHGSDRGVAASGARAARQDAAPSRLSGAGGGE